MTARPKRFVVAAAAVLAVAVLLLAIPISTSKHNTLNPLQVRYYSLRASHGSESALIPLCYHYVFGEKKDVEKGTYWVDQLSMCDQERYASRAEVFRLGIEQMKHEQKKESLELNDSIPPRGAEGGSGSEESNP